MGPSCRSPTGTPVVEATGPRLPVEVDPSAQPALEGDPVRQAGPDHDAVRCRDQLLLAGEPELATPADPPRLLRELSVADNFLDDDT